MQLPPRTETALVTEALRRSLLVVIVLAIAGALAGGWYGHHREGVHQATAVILIDPLEGNPFSPDGSGDELVNLETEARLVTSDAVAQKIAAEQNPVVSAKALLKGISVTVPANTQILQITATNKDADLAVARAQAFAVTYLADRKAHAQSTVSARAAHATEQMKQSSTELRAKIAELTAAPEGSPTALLIQQQVIQITTQIGQLRTQLATLEATPLDAGQVVTPASAPSAGPLGTREVGAFGGFALGVAAGLVFAVSRTRSDKRIRHPSALAGRGLPILGVIPGPAADGMQNLAEVARIRAALLAAEPQRPLVVLVGTSSPEGSAHSAAELGVSLGRTNLEVVVVDTAGSYPLELTEGQLGLVDVLMDLTTADDVLKPFAPHLWRMSPGSQPDRLDDLVAAPEMTLIVQELRKRADVVLLSAGSMRLPRTQSLIRLADATLIEVEEGVGTLDDVDRAIHDLTTSGGALTGLVYLPSIRRPRWWRRRGKHD
ncbi:MAG: lipopolysaccharide biosynthesis protein [Marmoricola sp.]|nr:lipopolysaccharide biosynthesis protein [Marmoricola sp.]